MLPESSKNSFNVVYVNTVFLNVDIWGCKLLEFALCILSRMWLQYRKASFICSFSSFWTQSYSFFCILGENERTFKKVTFSCYETATLHRCFSRLLNCTNGTKSHEASHMNGKKERLRWKTFTDISIFESKGRFW